MNLRAFSIIMNSLGTILPGEKMIHPEYKGWRVSFAVKTLGDAKSISPYFLQFQKMSWFYRKIILNYCFFHYISSRLLDPKFFYIPPVNRPFYYSASPFTVSSYRFFLKVGTLSDKISADKIFWHQVEISAVLSDEIFSLVSYFPIQFTRKYVLTRHFVR